MKITISQIINNYKKAKAKQSKWVTEAKEDLLYSLGDQWKAEDKETVESQGRPALTINLIQPLILLASGYQRNARSTIRAYPEGKEDEISSEIITRLIKNILKRSRADIKTSQLFEEGIQIGRSFLEPDIDYTYDLLTGEMRFKNCDPTKIYVDPNCKEYDLSDAKYIIKETWVGKEELQEMFPDLSDSKLEDLEAINDLPDEADIKSEDILQKGEDYPDVKEMKDNDLPESTEKEPEYKLLEHYYKKYFTQFIAIDVDSNTAQTFDGKKEAQDFLDQIPNVDKNKQKIIKKKIPQIWRAVAIGKTIIDDDVSPFYPKWKSYHFLPYAAHYTPLAKTLLKRDDLAFQGMVRGLKDMQREKNKRRSQALHIINSIANSGWIEEEGCWANKPDEVRQFGSTPGIHLQVKKGVTHWPERLYPANVPAAHVLFENKSEEDIKQISGINPDMLAMDDKTTSGRAIALRQQQGVLMLKRIFDNLTWTMELQGRFILSQLGELFTTQKALKVLGGDFIQKHFSQTMPDGSPEMPEIALGRAMEYIGNLLNSDELEQFDIAVGEGMDSPTTRYTQYLSLMELAEKGMPIPPEILLDYADIPETAKKDIATKAASAMP